MDFGVDILWYILPVLGAIMILVFVHEMGHFLFAKLFGMRVERFSVGFPPKVIGKTIGDTEYVLGATPLGGYVKIAGMVDESMDADQLASEPAPDEFRAKPVWQRIVVITAGVVFNVILAAVIFTGLRLAYGDEYIPAENVSEVYVQPSGVAYGMGLRTGDRIVAVSGRPLERYDDLQGLEGLLADPMTITVERGGEEIVLTGPDDIMTQLNRQGGLGVSPLPSLVGAVIEDAPAAEAGLRAGDRITAIGGEPIRFWYEMTDRLQAADGAPLAVRFERPDSLAADAGDAALAPPVARRPGVAVYETILTPRREEAEDRYVLGVYAPDPSSPILLQEFGVRRVSFTFGEAVQTGVAETWINTKAIATSLQRVFTGRENFRENVGGPVMIAKVTKQAAEAGARVFWNIVAILSITLAIMNILPIPALDGGHLMFLLYEAVTRREPSLRIRMAMQQVGMILLLAFMTFLIFNDILRL